MELDILKNEDPIYIHFILIIANIINIIYNLPQIIQTYKTKKVEDINGYFIILRIIGNSLWIIYGIYINNKLLILNDGITVFASIFLAYYKLQSICNNNIIPC